MIRHLLDTDTCIEIMRNRTGPALDRLRKCPDDSVGISTVTLAELQYGVSRSSDEARNRAVLSKFCAPIILLPFDHAAALTYGQLRAKLVAAGTPAGPLDTLIAAHALALVAILVTNNLREFRRIPGLSVESWVR